MTDDFTWLKGSHTFTARHPQRVLQVPEPVHPRLFRQVWVRQPGSVRAGSGAGLRLQLLGDWRSAAVGAIPRPPVRVLRGRSVAASASNLSLTFGVRVDIPTFPDKPTRNPVTESTFGYATDEVPGGRAVVAAGGLQLRARREQHGTDSRRPRAVLRPNAVRVAVEPVSATRATNSAGCTSRSARGQPQVPFSHRSERAADERSATAATNEIDVIDPDYKYPSLMRGRISPTTASSGSLAWSARRRSSTRRTSTTFVREPEPGAGRHAAGRPTLLHA